MTSETTVKLSLQDINEKLTGSLLYRPPNRFNGGLSAGYYIIKSIESKKNNTLITVFVYCLTNNVCFEYQFNRENIIILYETGIIWWDGDVGEDVWGQIIS